MNLPIIPVRAHFTQPKLKHFNWDKTILPENGDKVFDLLNDIEFIDKQNQIALYISNGLTAEEFLVLFYKTLTVNEISKKLNCHRNVVLRKAKKLALGTKKKANEPGGSYQDDKLIECYEKSMCYTCIAMEMNRSQSAIEKKIQRLVSKGAVKRRKSKALACPNSRHQSN